MSEKAEVHQRVDGIDASGCVGGVGDPRRVSMPHSPKALLRLRVTGHEG